MRNTFRILFYVKKNAPLRNGKVPVMGRITINGMRTQLSTQLAVDAALWDVARGCVTGRSAAAVRINERLRHIRFRIEQCYDALFREQRLVTPQMVKELYFGDRRRDASLLAFFRQHNEEFGRMVGISRSKNTYYKYQTVCRRLEEYVRGKYRRRDIAFGELDREFLTGFHAYIVQECGYRKNTTWIYLIALKHILMLARSRGYLACDLFADYRLRSESVLRNYLSLDEINRLLELEIADPTLRLVRDAFLFSCFTGLSYIDLRSLTPHNIRRAENHLWISTTRRKTGSEVHVRLFAVPDAILGAYLPPNACAAIFPLPSNGWCNACLERIMPLAGIERRITFHAARHTFATTVTLSQGMAIETISKLLGHKNIRTTQIYASVTHPKLNGELDRLSRRIDSLCRPRTPGVTESRSDTAPEDENGRIGEK